MKLIFQGKDITRDVSINACTHDMFAEGRSDSLVIKFNDSGLWDSWDPKSDNTVAVEMDSARTGKMFVHTIKPENGKYTLKALSVPTSYSVARSKSWERVRLLQIGQEIADRHGLSFKHFGVEDQVYQYLIQDAKNDFVFLHERCKLEECAFLVFDGSLIMYSNSYIEKQGPSQTLIINPDTKFEFEAYGSCRLGVIWGAFISELAAGSVVNLQTKDLPSWDGPILIHRIRHDYVQQKSKIFFRKPGGIG